MKEYNQAGRWRDQLHATYKCLNEVVIDTFEELDHFENEYDEYVGAIRATRNDYSATFISQGTLDELFDDVESIPAHNARVRIGIGYDYREVYLLRAGRGGEHVSLGYDKMYDLVQVLALLEEELKNNNN